MTTRRNPSAVPADTTPEVWRRQMAIIAATPIPTRLARWEALNRAGAEMEEAAVRRRHPGYDDHDVLLALTRLRDGDELVRGAWPDEPSASPSATLIDLAASLRSVTSVLDDLDIPHVDALLRDPDLHVPEEDGRRAVREGGTFNVLHPASGGKVDPFAQPTGVDCWVATPEDVVLARLRWRLASRSEVPWTDCVEIAASQRQARR